MEECDTVALDSGATVPLAWGVAQNPLAVLVIAPHSSAGLGKPFMQELAGLLAAQGISTLRFEFPFMRTLSKRPSPLHVLAQSVHGAMAAARSKYPGLPVFLGGSSFGARVVAEMQAKAPADNVHGLVLLGFPLHPVNRPSAVNARPLLRLPMPKLFIQGVGDSAADPIELDNCVRSIPASTLRWVETNDNSLRSISRRESRSGDSGALETAHAISGWIEDRLTPGACALPEDPRLNLLDGGVRRAEEVVLQQRRRVDELGGASTEGSLAGHMLLNWVEALEFMRWKRDLLRWLLAHPGDDPRLSQPALLASTPPVIAQALEEEIGPSTEQARLPAKAFRDALERLAFNRFR